MVELNARIKDIPMPARIKALPINSKGFPIPWFVADQNGSRDDLRVVGTRQFIYAVQRHLCWICGERLGIHLCFAVGPMCTVNRISSEPPSHRECAEYAVRACPFLSQPAMRRNEKDLPEDAIETAGVMLKHNPGVTALWITKKYHVSIHRLVEMGEPEEVAWWANGQPATRQQVVDAMTRGMPKLRELAHREGPAAEAALDKAELAAVRLLPPLPPLKQEDWDADRDDKWKANLSGGW